MKLFGCTFVKNEEGMIPYVMPYVERLGYDKFVVYDDDSTDNTVAELSKYPFVEIRQMEETKTLNEFDCLKRDKQANFFTECWQYIYKNNNEDVWMTFTDFDEVLFCSGRLSFKQEIKAYDDVYHKCYLNKPLVQIIDIGCKKRLNNAKDLIHTESSVRMNFWENLFSEKVTLLKVNAFEEITCYSGNHFIKLKPKDEYKKKKDEGCNISLNNAGIFHNFHLKWINYSELEKKHETTKNKEISDLKSSYDNILASTYPVDMYFALDSLYCTLKSDARNPIFY